MGLKQEVDLVELEESEVEPAQLEQVLEEQVWYPELLAEEQDSQNLEKVISSHTLAFKINFASISNPQACNSLTQTFLIYVSHTWTLIGYSAGGAGVLPGGGMLSKILTLQQIDGLNCHTAHFFFLTQAYVTPVEPE